MTAPSGFATVTPYFFVEDAPVFRRFLVEGLGGIESLCSMDGDRIANCQVAIGNTTVMLSEAGRGYPAMPASYYIYVDDAEVAMARAKAAGAAEVMAIADMPYGDRQGGVRDPHGNLWWISQRLVEGPYI